MLLICRRTMSQAIHFNTVGCHLKVAMKVCEIAEGGYSNVCIYRCRFHCERTFVVKKLIVQKEKVEHIIEMLTREFSIGMMLDHPCIVKPMDIDLNATSIVFQHFESLDLLEYVVHYSVSKDLFLQMEDILDALCYMHDKGVAHMDVKLENILYDTTSKRLKLIDFGNAKVFKVDDSVLMFKDICGTEGYLPPEMYKAQPRYFADRVDVWCVGIVLYNLLFDSMPWVDAKVSDDIYREHMKSCMFDKIHPIIFSKTNYKFEIEDKIVEELFSKTLHTMNGNRASMQDIKDIFMRLSKAPQSKVPQSSKKFWSKWLQ